MATDGTQRTDGELLAVFAETGDQTAFAELIERHGTMVAGVARSILGDYHEAQDVAQAVFLVLARKARQLRSSTTAASWLHRVAHDLAVNAARGRSRRPTPEQEAGMNEPVPETPERMSEEQRGWLYEHLRALPDRYRAPLVLCYLENQPDTEVAKSLGLNPAALRKRLERGRERLRSRLSRCGWAVSVGAVTTLLSAEAGAAVLPATFVSATAQAAGLAAAGKLAAGLGAGTVSAKVAALTKGAVNMLFWNGVKTAVVAVTASVVVAGSGVVVAQQVAKAREVGPKQSVTETSVAHNGLPTGTNFTVGTGQLKVEADTISRFSGKTNLVIALGNVVMTRGDGSTIRSDRMMIKEGGEGEKIEVQSGKWTYSRDARDIIVAGYAVAYTRNYSAIEFIERTAIAQNMFESLMAGVVSFRADTGAYPSSGDGLQSLIKNSGEPGWRGPYLRLPGQDKIPTDPWGTPYRYRLIDGACRIDSAGPGKTFGTTDDIVGPQPIAKDKQK